MHRLYNGGPLMSYMHWYWWIFWVVIFGVIVFYGWGRPSAQQIGRAHV